MTRIEVTPELAALGFKPFFVQQALERTELEPASALPGRVVCERRGEYLVQNEHGARRAKLSGRLEHELASDARPTVGDWVFVEPADPIGRIDAVLERQSLLARRNVDGTSHAQALAANVDVCFVVAALAPDGTDRHVARRGLNLRRIERYLLLARTSRIPALVVVNKADLTSAAETALAELRDALPAVEVILVSALDGRGVEQLRERVPAGETAVLVGSSGVGKSTLTNRLLGREVQRTAEIREEDARGRHTTTERELYRVPDGGLLIDTPGLRELALHSSTADDDGETGFADIDALAERCRFRDCTHHTEPGCAVREALEAGALDAARLESARKLLAEQRHQRERVDARLRDETKRHAKSQTRALQAQLRRKRGE